MMYFDPMWVTFGIIAIALVLYATEIFAIELTSLLILATLVVFFHFMPPSDFGTAVTTADLLSGFAEPALITVLSLLVIGQALVSTGALDQSASLIMRYTKNHALIATILILFLVLFISGFLNNVPVVVIFIPIMQSMTKKMNLSSSKLMIPLSYAAILGGSTTLIGSSTNLLVANELFKHADIQLGFFDFTGIGALIAIIGFVALLIIVPLLLVDRSNLEKALVKEHAKPFLIQITIPIKSKLIGEESVAGFFPSFKNLSIMMVQRGEHAEYPPFMDMDIRAGDILIISGTKEHITDFLKEYPSLVQHNNEFMQNELHDPDGSKAKAHNDMMMAEIMITPNSRMIGLNLEKIGFRHWYRCIVLGIQRRAKMFRKQVTEMTLEGGDVLLIQGRREDIKKLRGHSDLLLIEWSKTDLPSPHHAKRAAIIFGLVIAASAFGVMPILLSSLLGVCAMLVTKTVSIRQAARALDRRIVLMIASSMAMGVALQGTGGADFIANLVTDSFGVGQPWLVVSLFFLVVAVCTNILSNNACAILFTPVGINLAHNLDMAPMVFAITVILAANCSFATPVGYQTNLLVMGPGHYRFADFLRAGIPMVIVMWLAFSIVAPWYFG